MFKKILVQISMEEDLEQVATKILPLCEIAIEYEFNQIGKAKIFRKLYHLKMGV